MGTFKKPEESQTQKGSKIRAREREKKEKIRAAQRSGLTVKDRGLQGVAGGLQNCREWDTKKSAFNFFMNGK